MCEYCERVTGPGTVGRTYPDERGGFCALLWLDGYAKPILQVNSYGRFASILVDHCPICGRYLRTRWLALQGVKPSREAGA